jgi:predicted phage-related endonuclease
MDDRTTYIGGSDVGAILGVSEYRGPVATWRQKRGLDPSTSGETPIMRAGHHMESFILREFEAAGLGTVLSGADTPNGPAWAQETIRHPVETWAGATLDAFGSDEGGLFVIDCKMSRKAIDPADPTTVPDDWTLQLHHYAWVTGVERAALAVCRVGGAWDTIRADVPIDLQWYESAIVPKLRAFWQSVQDGVEPPVPVYVERNPLPILDCDDAVRAYIDAAAAEREAAEKKEQAREILLRSADSAGMLKKYRAGGATISVVVSQRDTIDLDTLRANHPDIAAALTRRGEISRSVRVTASKGKA